VVKADFGGRILETSPSPTQQDTVTFHFRLSKTLIISILLNSTAEAIAVVPVYYILK
jgi:hypothetical protein